MEPKIYHFKDILRPTFTSKGTLDKVWRDSITHHNASLHLNLPPDMFTLTDRIIEFIKKFPEKTRIGEMTIVHKALEMGYSQEEINSALRDVGDAVDIGKFREDGSMTYCWYTLTPEYRNGALAIREMFDELPDHHKETEKTDDDGDDIPDINETEIESEQDLFDRFDDILPTDHDR